MADNATALGQYIGGQNRAVNQDINNVMNQSNTENSNIMDTLKQLIGNFQQGYQQGQNWLSDLFGNDQGFGISLKRHCNVNFKSLRFPISLIALLVWEAAAH